MVNYKTKFSPEQLSKIQELFDKDYGSRKIAQILFVNRSTIIRAYKQLGLDSKNKKTPKIIINIKSKQCKGCSEIKLIENFRKRKSYESDCKECEYNKNLVRLKNRAKQLRKESPNFVIRRSVSYFIWKSLKQSKSSKNGKSCLDYLGYKIKDLKCHLENQFESWMNWGNHGNYSKTWNDDDQSTWTWQIDHIIPQTSLPYGSMEEDNFKKCWSLNNLRPLSAKQNHSDGVSRIRHMSV